MTDEIERITPAVRNPAIRAEGDPDADPYGKDVFCTSGKEAVYRLVFGPEGGIASVEGVPEEERLSSLPKKKPKTNKRGNRWL